MFKRWWLLVGLVFGCPLYGQDDFAEAPDKLELRGYLKAFQGASFGDDADSIYSISFLHHRINLRYDPLEQISFRLEARSRVFYGEYVRNIPGLGSYLDRDDGFVNLSILWIDKRSLVVHTMIDRALVDISAGDLSIGIGRQRINWGVTTLWNPNDIFNTYNFLDFDYEERPGTDAVRARYHFSPFTSIDVGLSPAKHADSTIAAALYKFNTAGYDIQILAGLYRSDYVGGLGFAGSIADVGVKGEVSYFKAKADSARNSAVASVMGDYTLSDNWYLACAYLYTGDPQGRLSLLSNIGSSLTPKNLMPFRHTIYLGASKAFTPITSASMALMYSPTDNTVIVLPRLDHSIAESFDLSILAQLFWSEAAQRFDLQGGTLYLGIRWTY